MQDELVELSYQLLNAIQERDAEALDTILADDFRHFDSCGASLGKEEFVRGIVEAQYRILSIGFETLEVTSVDESAVVLGVQTAEVRMPDGEVLTSRSGFTDVFTRDGKTWVIRLAHSVDP